MSFGNTGPAMPDTLQCSQREVLPRFREYFVKDLVNGVGNEAPDFVLVPEQVGEAGRDSWRCLWRVLNERN